MAEMGGTSVFTITPEQAAQIAAIESRLVPGRACGTCSLCCKVGAVAEFSKPAGRWCTHARPGKGCAIYTSRPVGCRGIYCYWMLSADLGPAWKPDVAKFAIFLHNGGTRLTAHVDPGSPAAWRREPYYSTLKRWAVTAAQQRPHLHLIDVMVGDKLTVILPDREVEIGVLAADEMVALDARTDGTIAVRVIKAAQAQAAPAA